MRPWDTPAHSSLASRNHLRGDYDSTGGDTPSSLFMSACVAAAMKTGQSKEEAEQRLEEIKIEVLIAEREVESLS